MNFKETLEGLKLENENCIAQECKNEMLNSEILFNSGFEQEKKRLTSLYKLRLRIANENATHKKDELLSLEIAVKNLENSSAELLNLNWLRTELKLFLIFWDNESKKLVGIFYLYQKTSIQKTEENYLESIERGNSVSAIKYEKGKFIKEWK
jgi:hypothetical protein